MIVVLTLGRSGSSLLMQTLRELGVDVAGELFRKSASAEHYEGNPKGYFEDPHIYRHGLNSENFRALIGSTNCACKMDLRHLIASNELLLWQEWKSQLEAIYLSVREPSEQARSEYLGHFAEQNRSPLNEFQFTTQFLAKYVRVLKMVATLLAEGLSPLKSKIHLVNYADAQRNPLTYVRRIATTANLNATGKQIDAAVNNIESKLHRIKRETLPSINQQWAERLQARDVFELLTFSTDPWSQLLARSKSS